MIPEFWTDIEKRLKRPPLGAQIRLAVPETRIKPFKIIITLDPRKYYLESHEKEVEDKKSAYEDALNFKIYFGLSPFKVFFEKCSHKMRVLQNNGTFLFSTKNICIEPDAPLKLIFYLEKRQAPIQDIKDNVLWMPQAGSGWMRVNYSKSSLLDDICNQIKKECNKREQVRLALEWISSELNFSAPGPEENMPINEIIKGKNTTCIGFTAVFRAMMQKLNIPCICVGGIPSNPPKGWFRMTTVSPHVWNEVKIGAQWIPVDATVYSRNKEKVFERKPFYNIHIPTEIEFYPLFVTSEKIFRHFAKFRESPLSAHYLDCKITLEL